MTENPFTEGQKIVCINDHWPVVHKTNPDSPDAHRKPKKGEALIVDETLGEFLRFGKYDDSDGLNWWFWNRFAPYNEFEAEMETQIAEALGYELVTTPTSDSSKQ